MTTSQGKIRIGFLGGGFIAHHHGKMLHIGSVPHEITAVHDPDAHKASEFAKASGASVVASEEELFSAVDAVYVCTWTSEHRRLVEDAARRGLPVFCEKPLAFDVGEARAMVAAVASAGVVNQVGLVLRDSPSFNLLRAMVSDPTSGRVMSVMFRDDQYIPIQGQYASTWRSDVARAGAGTLLEHSIHDLDILEWLFGEVREVTARSAEFHAINGIEDVVMAQLGFASGAFAALTSVWHDIMARPSSRRMEVLCERAFLVLEGDVWGPVRRVTDRGGEEVFEGTELVAELGRRSGGFRNPDEAFLQAVRDGTPATPTFADALRPHMLADAVYQSAGDDGRRVSIASGQPGDRLDTKDRSPQDSAL